MLLSLLLLQIYRCGIDGNLPENVYQSAARDLVIDAVGGYLFWTTPHSVECSRLNGHNHLEVLIILFRR